MPGSKTIKPEAKEWFRAHRPQFVGEKMVASRLYRQNLWWFQIAEQVIDNNGGHINALCENCGYAEPRFHHLRIPVSFIAENRDDLGFRDDINMFSLYFSANPQTLFREERGQGKIDFSQFIYPPTGGGNKHANNTTPANNKSGRVFVFIDLENELSKEDASDILVWLSGKAGLITEGAACTARAKPAYSTWEKLLRMHNIKIKRALSGVKNAADAKLIAELTSTIPHLKNGDCICVVGSEGIYSQPVADALALVDELGKEIRALLHFGKRKPKRKPKDARYRFFLIGDPAKWQLP